MEFRQNRLCHYSSCMPRIQARAWFALSLFLLIALGSDRAVGDDNPAASIRQELEAAKRELVNDKYLLRYKYRAGDVVRYNVEHLVAVDTTIADVAQQTKLQTKSERSLRIVAVESSGSMQLEHTIDSIALWSDVTGRESVHFDSRSGHVAPPEYETMAASIGKPISRLTVDTRGHVVKRQDFVVQPEIGLGGITIPLPEQEIAPGATWSQSIDVRVRLEDQRIKTIRTREVYRLEKVETEVATISIRTEILTPIDDARVKSQLIQRISHGELRFDVEAGRMISKQLDWDDKVVGFAGAGSNMKYLARFSESLSSHAAMAQATTTASVE